MTRTRLNTRFQNIEKLTNLKNGEKRERVRLSRKMDLLEQPLINVNYTIRGTVEEIEMEVKRIKKERKESAQKMQKVWNQLNRVKERIYNYKTAIQRLQQLSYMEADIEFYYWYGKQTNLFSTKNNKNIMITDPLLLKINNLPYDMMNLVQEYFTFETRAVLLESKYDPLKMLNKFNSRQIGEIINTIFNINVLDLLDNDTKENVLFKFTTFYAWGPLEDPRLRLKRTVTDERVFLKNIVLSFKPNHHMMLFGMYRFIILLHRIIV